MLAWIKRKLHERRVAKLEQSYQNGFDWAAGVLLRGDMTPLEVQMQLEDPFEEALDDFELAFDDGATFALDLICKNKIAVIDNRHLTTFEFIQV